MIDNVRPVEIHYFFKISTFYHNLLVIEEQITCSN